MGKVSACRKFFFLLAVGFFNFSSFNSITQGVCAETKKSLRGTDGRHGLHLPLSSPAATTRQLADSGDEFSHLEVFHQVAPKSVGKACSQALSANLVAELYDLVLAWLKPTFRYLGISIENKTKFKHTLHIFERWFTKVAEAVFGRNVDFASPTLVAAKEKFIVLCKDHYLHYPSKREQDKDMSRILEVTLRKFKPYVQAKLRKYDDGKNGGIMGRYDELLNKKIFKSWLPISVPFDQVNKRSAADLAGDREKNTDAKDKQEGSVSTPTNEGNTYVNADKEGSVVTPKDTPTDVSTDAQTDENNNSANADQ